jgi:hypothetical protein
MTPIHPAEESKEPKVSGLSYITASLNSLDISRSAFRLYCHILYRAGGSGECWESVPNMGKSIGMDKNTAWKAIAELLEGKLISKEKRHGSTTIFRPLSPDVWTAPVLKIRTAEKLRRHPSEKIGRRSSENLGRHPSQKLGHKVTNQKLQKEVTERRGSAPRRMFLSEAHKTKEEMLKLRDEIKDHSRKDAHKWRINGKLTEAAQNRLQRIEERIAECDGVILGDEARP